MASQESDVARDPPPSQVWLQGAGIESKAISGTRTELPVVQNDPALSATTPAVPEDEQSTKTADLDEEVWSRLAIALVGVICIAVWFWLGLPGGGFLLKLLFGILKVFER